MDEWLHFIAGEWEMMVQWTRLLKKCLGFRFFLLWSNLNTLFFGKMPFFLFPLGFPTQKALLGRFVPFLCSFHRAENAAERQGRLPRCPGTSPNCNPIPLFIKKRERAERGRHWADSLIVMLLSDNSANLIHLFHLNLAAMSPTPFHLLHPLSCESCTHTQTDTHRLTFLRTLPFPPSLFFSLSFP